MSMFVDWLRGNQRNISLIACLLTFSLTTGVVARNWPTASLVFFTGISSLLAIVICGGIVPPSIADRVDKSIFVLSCTAGGILNMIVRIANNGCMPVLNLTIVHKLWIPMNGARLTWMGDWLVGGYSIGDGLMITGLLWIIYCIAKWRVVSISAEKSPASRKDRLVTGATQ